MERAGGTRAEELVAEVGFGFEVVAELKSLVVWAILINTKNIDKDDSKALEVARGNHRVVSFL